MNAVSSGLVIFDHKMREERGYWIKRLSGLTSGSNIWPDYERPDAGSEARGRLEVSLNGQVYAKLEKLTGSGSFLLYTTLMAALKICLYKYTGDPTVIAGSPARKQDDPTGQAINALAIVDDVDDNISCKQLLLNIRGTLLEAYARQDYPFERLVKDLGLGGPDNRCPLFDVALALEDIHSALPDVRNDITLALTRRPDHVSGTIIYKESLFEPESIQRFWQHFINVLGAMLDTPNARIGEMDMLSAAERRQLIFEWNDTRSEETRDKSILELFERQVARSPEAVAILFEGRPFTYAEVNRRANQLANHLRELGVRPEVIVAILLERSVEMIIAVLGVLKAGGAYMPLDPEYPRQRLDFMLDDSKAAVLLTQQPLLQEIQSPPSKVICLDSDSDALAGQCDENPVAETAIDNLAYVIYTSGSTGAPKGVMVTHRGLHNLVEAQIEVFDVQSESRVLQFASLSFDASVSEIFTTLLAGATLVMSKSESIMPGQNLAGTMRKEAISIVTLPPSALAAFNDDPPCLRTVIAAGEACSASIVERWSAGRRFLNAYGPTEATICATIAECVDVSRPPSIGRSISNTQVYILDRSLNPVAVGVPGELYIAGLGLARGYLDRPELTAEKFIPNPFSAEPGARLYRTGDSARFLPGGNIDFIGRVDHQVKIRGFRVELGELDAVLSQHSAVREVVTTVREDVTGDKRLIAYLVPEPEQAVSITDLRSFLIKRVPEHMLPSAFVFMDALPLTPNGKIDRGALPSPDHSRPELNDSFIAPRTPIEEVVAGILSKVLGIDRIGVNDNFFELGGHSLFATQATSRLRSAFGVESSLRSLFDSPNVAGLAKRLESALRTEQGLESPPITQAQRTGPLPLSFAQQRLWFLDQLQPNNASYNIPLAVRLRGHLDPSALKRSLSEVITRHEVLRTTFERIGGEPEQVIAHFHELCWLEVNVEELHQDGRESEALRLAVNEAKRPFDLSSGPLLRTLLVRLRPDEHMMILNMHHIISDGWSISILVREITTLYGAFSTGLPSPLLDLSVQYADFANWQRQWLQGEMLERQLEYWKKQLGGTLPVLDLPTDRPRSMLPSHRGAHRTFLLAASLTDELKKLNREEGVTMFMTLVAAFQTLMYRYTGQEDVIVGTDVANRNRIETEPLIGFFVNQLVLRTDLSGSPTFRTVLKRVRKVTIDAYSHQDLPFEKLVQAVQPERDMGRAPFFQIKLLLQNTPAASPDLPGLRLSPVQIESGTSKFDITLSVTESAQGLHGLVEYDTDLFDSRTIDRLLEHFERLLEGGVTEPDRRVSDLPILSQAEMNQLLYEWNGARTENPYDSCIHELFQRQVEQTPHAIAVVSQQGSLTYSELNQKANQLAHYLRKMGMGPEMIIGICMNRSVDVIVAVLATLKAGGAYMPLDPAYPVERLAFMLEDARCPVLLTQEELIDSLPAGWAHVVCVDSSWEEIALESEENPAAGLTADNLAYVIYTSGSTGRPKGVLVQHRGLSNLAEAQVRTFGVRPDDRVLQFSSLSFDASIFEIVMALYAGASLFVPVQRSLIPGPELVRLVNEAGVTNATLPPSVLSAVPHEELPQLRTLISAGEACSAELVERWADSRQFFNAYGPTEATVWATVAECAVEGGAPQIGKPIQNARVYVMDSRLRPVPVGVSGELCIGGIGLARGYLNRPDLTAERFVPDPIGGEVGARLYKTGDLARYLPEGDIEFLGRIDNQVKLRGFRIELGEIEAVLCSHPAVREVAVQARQDAPGNNRLIAYVVAAENHEPGVNELRGYLKERLPDHMVPSAFIFIEAMPLTPNGKLDRNALPSPDGLRPKLESAYVAPQTKLEQAIASIWKEALHLERVSVQDNFFDLGGHSLLMVQVQSGLQDVLKREVSIVELFTYPNISSLAKHLSQQPGQDEALEPIRDRAKKQKQAKSRKKELSRGRVRSNE